MSQSPIATKAIKFIELAKQLHAEREVDTSLYEAKVRTSIGRLYYGVFNLLKDRFLNCGKFRSKDKASLQEDDAHYTLKNCISNTEPTMRTHIDKLRILRNLCDYDLEVDVAKELTIKTNSGYSISYDDIEYAYADAIASAITLISTYTNHRKYFDNRGYGMINISPK
ncbi:hypothetical protein [Sulfurimonas sp. HSL-1716]|uniref:hypothetical protein n=1 Tax=Hydrocurvibacter sulfurireducens TaxID=3131937 RepID=UPI0031F91687